MYVLYFFAAIGALTVAALVLVWLHPRECEACDSKREVVRIEGTNICGMCLHFYRKEYPRDPKFRSVWSWVDGKVYQRDIVLGRYD